MKGGKRPGAGRPRKAEPVDIAALFDEAWPQEERKKVIAGLNRKAKMGDSKAAGLLMAYAWGRPKEQIEHSGEIGVKIVKIPAKMVMEQWSAQKWEQSKNE